MVDLVVILVQNETDPTGRILKGKPDTYVKGPYERFTGTDGIDSHITFYNKYLGSDKFAKIFEIYNGNSDPTAFDGTRICEDYPGLRGSFPTDCSVWKEVNPGDPINNIPAAELITGTSDGLQAPFIFQEGKSADDIVVWVDDAQRRVVFTKTSDRTFEDVKLWRYTMHPDTMKNVTTATNKDLCLHYYQTNNPSGIFSRQRADGIDTWLSKPHFFSGDYDFHHSQIDININPTLETHETFLDVEPLTGKVFSGRKRLQLGVALNSVRYQAYGIYGRIVVNYAGYTEADNTACNVLAPGPSCGGGKNLYLPILWAVEGKDISTSDASSFTKNVYGNRQTFFVTQIVLVIVGGVMFFTFLILCIKARQGTTSL